jgi:acyl carrier protein
MWSERVTVRPLGVMDHFFALGGDSLDAVRLLAMVERRYGTRIDRSRLFQSFTVATMAELLNEALGGRDD